MLIHNITDFINQLKSFFKNNIKINFILIVKRIVMRNLIYLSFLLFTTVYGFGQVVNINPDKTGEPWLVGGLRLPTQTELAKIKTIKNVSTPTKNFPSSLDNSELRFFRPIFEQEDGSCAQSSGIGYTYTYEMNRANGTSANDNARQFPSHYTYNFLNSGSGDNGSWYQDGWDIISANGCPTVATYGGMAISDTYWLSGYAAYAEASKNRLTDYFAIDVSNYEGLATLKTYFMNHLDDSETGGIVNFAAGVNYDDGFYSTFDNIITRWGSTVNHAMTFVGWDDNIEYDYNGDSFITTDVDINNDQIVDMKDAERGALIMVNSWGTGWGNNGKAYVMYKTLADTQYDGGIFQNQVYGINVRPNYEPSLSMRVRMNHEARTALKIRAGISTNLTSELPEHIIDLPLFNRQGGYLPMRGADNYNDIEFELDITPLLSFINSGDNAKFFLLVSEYDYSDFYSGEIVDFSIYNSDNEYFCSEHNVPIVNNFTTYLSVSGNVNFNKPELTVEALPVAILNQSYNFELTAQGGTAPYEWFIKSDFIEQTIIESYPDISQNELTPSNYDDGYAELELGFDFPFYDEVYDKVYVLTDGSIVFKPQFDYLRSDEAIISEKIISVFASDLMIYPELGHGIFTQTDANSATVRWKVGLFGSEFGSVDVSLTLSQDGTIRMFYGSDISGAIGACGISKGDGFNYNIGTLSNSENPSENSFLFEPEPYPAGMLMSEGGLLFGTPAQTGSWNIRIGVKDFNKIHNIKSMIFQVDEESGISISSPVARIYPNPAVSELYISTKNNAEVTSVEILNIYGSQVFKNQTKEVSGELKIEIPEHITSGIYFVRINSDSGQYIQKIVIGSK